MVVDARTTDPAEILADLIRIPSVNPMGRTVQGDCYCEARLTKYLAEYFESLGIPYVRQPVLDQQTASAEQRASGYRCNLVALFEPQEVTGTVLLDAHQDTVPVDGMTIDPFEPVVRAGRMYGRGACDVKGGLAAMLSAVSRLVRERPRRAARVFLSCTCDEEAGATGIRHLMDGWEGISSQLCGRAIWPEAAIVAEPTDLKVVVAHRGVIRWRVVTRGRACHSSEPQLGKNAIYTMAHLVALLERYARLLADGHMGRHPLCGTPNLSVGRIEGGSSVNVVPDFCAAEIDRRLIPGENARGAYDAVREYLRSELRRQQASVEDHDWTFEEPWLVSSPLTDGPNQELADRLSACVERVLGRVERVGVRYGTHASRTAAAGIASVVFGPGSIQQAHTADEWISLEQLQQAAEVYYAFCRS